MSRRQLAALIGINAFVSALVAVTVLWAGVQIGWIAPGSPPTPYVIVPPTPTLRPTGTPAPPPKPTPTIETEIYVVQAGDTLLEIALRIEVDPELILALNNIGNADRLFEGQRLRVPLGTVPTATPAATPPATAVAGSDEPTSPQGQTAETPTSGATILEVITPGVLATEAILLTNPGQEPVSMEEWSLDHVDGRRYVFPLFTLRPGAVVLVHTRAGIDDREDLHWAQREPVWAPGSLVTLRSPTGETVSTFAIGE